MASLLAVLEAAVRLLPVHAAAGAIGLALAAIPISVELLRVAVVAVRLLAVLVATIALRTGLVALAALVATVLGLALLVLAAVLLAAALVATLSVALPVAPGLCSLAVLLIASASGFLLASLTSLILVAGIPAHRVGLAVSVLLPALSSAPL